MKRIAFATCAEHAGLVDDDRLAIPFLERRGIAVEPMVWDAPAPRDGFDAVVIRSCWDYHVKPREFADWLAAAQIEGRRLLNPAGVARWALDKRYLADVASWGFSVPKTVWLEAGAHADLGRAMDEAGIADAVVKPTVSLNGFDTFRVPRADAARQQGRLEAILRGRSAMIQRFVPEILTEGEVSLVFLGGAYSHAVRKRAKAGEFRIHEEHGGRREPCEPPPALVRQARELLARIGEPLVYARVDGIPVDGRLVLVEAELIDPLLFLGFSAGAPERFADAIARALG